MGTLGYEPRNKHLGYTPHNPTPRVGEYRVSSERNVKGVESHWVQQYQKTQKGNRWQTATPQYFDSLSDAMQWIGDNAMERISE